MISGSASSGNGGRAQHTKTAVDAVPAVRVIEAPAARARAALIVEPGAAAQHARPISARQSLSGIAVFVPAPLPHIAGEVVDALQASPTWIHANGGRAADA